MHKSTVAAGVVAALLMAVPAHAASGGLSVRGAVYYGTYYFESNSGGTESAKSPGAGAGVTFGVGRFFTDLGLDYFEVKDGNTDGFDYVRTDLALTGGVEIARWLTGFAGYRQAWQDTSTHFDDDVWSEDGYFLGASIGPFKMGRPLWLSTSLAYNFNTVEFPAGGGDSPYDGISGRIRVGLTGTPHAFELRGQRFENEDSTGTEINFSETYMYLGYVFSWSALNF
jgi:hypothetical protein